MPTRATSKAASLALWRPPPVSPNTAGGHPVADEIYLHVRHVATATRYAPPFFMCRNVLTFTAPLIFPTNLQYKRASCFYGRTG